MNIKYILYNPDAGNSKSQDMVEALKVCHEGAALINVHRISNYKVFFRGLPKDEEIVICGGDGTLNKFANSVRGLRIENKVYYCPIGTGNDFARDLGYNTEDCPLICINEYIENLPSVTVNGQTQLFINNVGFGIDGYCTEVGDELRAENKKNKTDKPINYTSIAIKGLLFKFSPRNATVTVDGKKHRYQKVWLAPTMNGRYYGGGMMPTPNQNRLGEEHKVSVMVFRAPNKLRALMMFPSIFKGEHIKYKKNVFILEGKDITVKFDRPTPLQIDGETILGVTSYSASAYRKTQSTASRKAEAV